MGGPMNLKEARFKKKYTQFDISLKTGIHQSQISHFEKGYLVPSADMKKKLNKALGTKLDWSHEARG